MKSMKATWINGKVVPDGPVDWPDGCRLTIDAESDRSFVGITEEEQGDDAESIARWIAAFEAIPPLAMSPDEESAWQGARTARKEFEVAEFERRAEALRRACE